MGAGVAAGTLLLGEASIQDAAQPQSTGRSRAVTTVQASTPLAVTMTASPNPARQGEFVTYTLTVTNRGPVDLGGVTLAATVPDKVYSFAVGNNGYNPGDTVTWTLGTLSAGQSRTVTMQPRIGGAPFIYVTGLEAPADGTTLQNVATVTSSTGHGATIHLTVRIGYNWPTIDAIPPYEIAETKPLVLTVPATDADMPTQTLTFSLEPGAPAGASIDSRTGVFSWTPTRAQGPSTNSITVRVTDSSSQRLSVTQTFTVIVIEANDPPVITPIPNQVVNEGSAVTFTVVVTDADLPQQTLTFSLGTGAPTGATINPATGVITWTTTEAHGPSTNVVTVIVADNGTPVLSATNTFIAVVNEVNTAPVLAAIPDQNIDEVTTLSLNAQATDVDLPAQKLTFSLDAGAPAGAAIDSTTGVFTWTPSEGQGPSTSRITVRVTDNGPPNLSDTKSFNVLVREVNLAPTLATIPDQTLSGAGTIRVQVLATDADLPANELTFSLEPNAPTGVAIDGKTGVFTWSIGSIAVPETNRVSVRVTDNGNPPLSSTTLFTVFLTPPRLNLSPIQDRAVGEGGLLTFTVMLTNSSSAIPPITYSLESTSRTAAVLNPDTGVLFWRTTEVDGPGTNTFTVRVKDGGSPQQQRLRHLRSSLMKSIFLRCLRPLDATRMK